MHLLRTLGLDWQGCQALWQASRQLNDYDRFVNCAKRQLGAFRQWPHILLQHRGQGFAIDSHIFGGDESGLMHSNMFMMHGLKNGRLFNATPCKSDPRCPVLVLKVLNDSAAKAEALMRDRELMKSRTEAFEKIGSLIQDCWPSCKHERDMMNAGAATEGTKVPNASEHPSHDQIRRLSTLRDTSLKMSIPTT